MLVANNVLIIHTTTYHAVLELKLVTLLTRKTGSCPNQAWVVELTYIWTDEGWLYLAGIKFLYTKELISCAINHLKLPIVLFILFDLAYIRKV